MTSLSKTLAIALTSFLILASPAFAQSATTTIVPTPEPGKVESDFAKDVREGTQSIKNDNNAQNNQKGIDENEVDEGQQENENVHVDNEIDQSEAQENEQESKDQEDVKGNQNGQNSPVKDEDNSGQQNNGSDKSGSNLKN